MPDNVTRFPGPKPTPLRSVSLDELFNDAPRMSKEERLEAIRWALLELAHVKARAASAEHALFMLLENEGGSK